MKRAFVTAACAVVLSVLSLAPSPAWSNTADGNADGLICIKLTSGHVLERDNTVRTRSACPGGFSPTSTERKSETCTGSLRQCGPGGQFQAACEALHGGYEGTNSDPTTNIPQTYSCHLP